MTEDNVRKRTVKGERVVHEWHEHTNEPTQTARTGKCPNCPVTSGAGRKQARNCRLVDFETRIELAKNQRVSALIMHQWRLIESDVRTRCRCSERPDESTAKKVIQREKRTFDEIWRVWKEDDERRPFDRRALIKSAISQTIQNHTFIQTPNDDDERCRANGRKDSS